MTPIERQILENQKAIMHNICESLDKDSLVGSRAWQCIIATNGLFIKEAEEKIKEEEPCCEMPKRNILDKYEEDVEILQDIHPELKEFVKSKEEVKKDE